MKPVLDELGEGATLMMGFGFASVAGFDSDKAAAKTAKSSGEHEISFASPPCVATRGRVWANDETDKSERAKLASKTQGNNFFNAIGRGLLLLIDSSFWYFYVRGAPLKDRGILAAETACFNRQCDCFVTKRRIEKGFELKEVTNYLRGRSI